MSIFEFFKKKKKLPEEWVRISQAEAVEDDLEDYRKDLLDVARQEAIEGRSDKSLETMEYVLDGVKSNPPSKSRVCKALSSEKEYKAIYGDKIISMRSKRSLAQRFKDLKENPTGYPINWILDKDLYAYAKAGLTLIGQKGSGYSRKRLDKELKSGKIEIAITDIDRQGGKWVWYLGSFADRKGIKREARIGVELNKIPANFWGSVSNINTSTKHPISVGDRVKVVLVPPKIAESHHFVEGSASEVNGVPVPSPYTGLEGEITNINGDDYGIHLENDADIVLPELFGSDKTFEVLTKQAPVAKVIGMTTGKGMPYSTTLEPEVVVRKVMPPENENLPHMERLKALYDLMTQYYKFENEEKSKIFFASLLIEDVKVLLKGVPGTGKTTLLEAVLCLMANPFDLEKSKLGIKNISTSKDAFKMFNQILSSEHMSQKYRLFRHQGKFVPIKGVARINPDKMPDEVLYYTDIVQWKKEGKENISAVLEKNPDEDTEKDKKREFDESAVITEKQRYEFIPKPRPIVTAPIKFYNEINRANRPTQDGILPLMAEGRVEQYGVELTSPDSISFFDYNPHLDQPETGGRELDQAFLDRIDLSIYITGLDYQSSKELAVQLLMPVGHQYDGKTKGIDAKSVGQSVLESLYHKKIIPLNLSELEQIWNCIKNMDVEDRVVDMCVVFMSLFKTSYRIYNNKYYSEGNTPKIPGSTNLDFIDLTKVTYGEKAVKAQEPQVSSSANSYVAYIDDIRRPLGQRALQSIIKLARAYAFMDYALDKPKSKILKSSPADVKVKEKHILACLPYVVEHRINLGVGPNIMRFLNFFDFVHSYLIPKVIEPNRAVWREWLEAKDITIREVEKRVAGQNWNAERLEKECLIEFDSHISAAGSSAKDLAEKDPILDNIRKMPITKLVGK